MAIRSLPAGNYFIGVDDENKCIYPFIKMQQPAVIQAGTIFPAIVSRTFFNIAQRIYQPLVCMKNKSDKELFSLLVRVYNHSIQSYFYFPEVIIFGRHRLEKEAFQRLLAEEYLDAYYTDSFGKLYRLNKNAEAFLHQYRFVRKRRTYPAAPSSFQSSFSFS